jgi:hypothetical protein
MAEAVLLSCYEIRFSLGTCGRVLTSDLDSSITPVSTSRTGNGFPFLWLVTNFLSCGYLQKAFVLPMRKSGIMPFNSVLGPQSHRFFVAA